MPNKITNSNSSRRIRAIFSVLLILPTNEILHRNAITNALSLPSPLLHTAWASVHQLINSYGLRVQKETRSAISSHGSAILFSYKHASRMAQDFRQVGAWWKLHTVLEKIVHSKLLSRFLIDGCIIAGFPVSNRRYSMRHSSSRTSTRSSQKVPKT